MLSRILAMVIVGFWATMTYYLVQLERHPDESDLLDVRPAYVLKVMFTHQQTSDLTITDHGQTVGNLMLHPKTTPGTNTHALIFSGGFSFQPMGSAKKQRISWDGDLALDGTYAMSSLALTASLQEPPYRVHMKFDPAQKTVAYELMMGARTVKTATIPMNQEGVSTLVREQLGIDPGIVLQNLPASTTHPTITAKQTELTIRKETVAAYLLTIKTGETTVAEIYVSQLGQVLAAKTLFGYDFAAEDTTPP